MRRRREQQQSVAAPRDHLRQPPSLRILAIAARPGTDAMMRLVNDRQIPRRSLEFLQHALLLREIERCQAKRDRVERIAAELQPSPLLLQRSGIGDGDEAQAEALPQLLRPLREQRPGGRDHQHAVRPPARDQFAGDQPRLYRLAQAHAVGEQQPRPRQFQRAHQRAQAGKARSAPGPVPPPVCPPDRAPVPADMPGGAAATPPADPVHPAGDPNAATRPLPPDAGCPTPGRPDRRRRSAAEAASAPRAGRPRSRPMPARAR